MVTSDSARARALCDNCFRRFRASCGFSAIFVAKDKCAKLSKPSNFAFSRRATNICNIFWELSYSGLPQSDALVTYARYISCRKSRFEQLSINGTQQGAFRVNDHPSFPSNTALAFASSSSATDNPVIFSESWILRV